MHAQTDPMGDSLVPFVPCPWFDRDFWGTIDITGGGTQRHRLERQRPDDGAAAIEVVASPGMSLKLPGSFVDLGQTTALSKGTPSIEHLKPCRLGHEPRPKGDDDLMSDGIVIEKDQILRRSWSTRSRLHRVLRGESFPV